MSGVGRCKYHVIQFLQVPYKDIAEFVCVPTTWVQSYGADVPFVKVSYPIEDPCLTEDRVMKRKRKSDRWTSFFALVRYSTDNYENAKYYIQQGINNLKKNKEDFHASNIQDKTNKSEKNNTDHTSTKANEKTSIPTQNATSRATMENDGLVMGMIDALGWCVSSKSADTITLKRKVRTDPDKKKHNKRFRVNEPDESDNPVAGSSSKALDCSSKHLFSSTPEDANEDTQETPVEKLNDSTTEIRQTFNQEPSKTTHSLDPKIITQLATSPIFAKWCRLMQELQEVFENSVFKELINKILNKDKDGSTPQNNDPITSASTDTTTTRVGAPNLNKGKINKKPLEEKHTDDDKDQHINNKKSINRVRKVKLLASYDDSSDSDLDFIEYERLPPEYDANDSRWTLMYPEPARGLIELMPHTGVYVTHLKRSSPHPTALARMLLSEIFTKNALVKCTLNDKRAKATDCDETNFRPALDEHAITVLINYVTDHAKKNGWPKIDTRSILKGISNKMRCMRHRYLISPSFNKELI